MSFTEIQKHLYWRAQVMRADATKARHIPGPGSIVYAVALEVAASSLEASAFTLGDKVREELTEKEG